MIEDSFTVYIGHDVNHSLDSRACYNSIRDHDEEVRIEFIRKEELIDRGWYWREKGSESTDFAFTRFLTPYLKGFYGYALFCDSDFVWQCSPREILEHVKREHEPNQWSVACVKHEMPENMPTVKMNGQQQKWYPRKNWASMMLFNCNHDYNHVLTPTTVSTQSAAWLFSMQWTFDKHIKALPREYNYLVGYDSAEQVPHPKAIHYTNGSPLYTAYSECEFNDLWRKYVLM